MACRPSVKEGIGEKSQFKQMKLELKSNKAAEFESDTNVFDIDLCSPDSIKTIYNLHHYDSNGAEEEVKNAVLIQTKNHTVTYHIAVQRTGWYKLNLFATPQSCQTNSLPCVYTYLFFVKKVKETVFPYPKQFADWTEGCYLHKPKWIDTNEELSKVKFKVDVPKATRVAVKAGDEWTHLERPNEQSIEWSGEVCLTHHLRNHDLVNLNACITSDQNSFATLLQYEFN